MGHLQSQNFFKTLWTVSSGLPQCVRSPSPAVLGLQPSNVTEFTEKNRSQRCPSYSPCCRCSRPLKLYSHRAVRLIGKTRFRVHQSFHLLPSCSAPTQFWLGASASKPGRRNGINNRTYIAAHFNLNFIKVTLNHPEHLSNPLRASIEGCVIYWPAVHSTEHDIHWHQKHASTYPLRSSGKTKSRGSSLVALAKFEVSLIRALCKALRIRGLLKAIDPASFLWLCRKMPKMDIMPIHTRLVKFFDK